jgi:signal transduction protein with GAF and PtsI domain
MGVRMNPSDRSHTSVLVEIERWIAGGEEPIRTLTNIACLVGNTLHCNACSIYLLEPSAKQLILCGTVGLRQECVGKIQMSLDEGLTGLVAQERQPVVVLTQAAAHPRFKYFPDAGEDLYDSFLGVPVLDRAALIGVLVVQTFERAHFTNQDVQRLSDIASGLGPLLAPIRGEAISRLTAALASP